MRNPANFFKNMLKLSLLTIGALVVLATSDPEPRVISGSVTDYWIAANIYDGQTAVSRDVEIELTIGWLDFQDDDRPRERARRAFEDIRLYPEETSDTVALDIDISENETVLRFETLEKDTWYVLDLTPLDGTLSSGRDIPEPIAFRTGSSPMVNGFFRNDDTLFIVFSEPMDPDSLRLAHDSVDILWQDEDELHSIVYDLNLADFAYDAEGSLFRVAPVRFLEDVWVKVSGNVRAESGVYLDGNGNDVAGEEGDDFLMPLDIQSLDTCVRREDIPAPCVSDDEVPDSWWSEW